VVGDLTGQPKEAGRVVTQAMIMSTVVGTLILGILEWAAPAIIIAAGSHPSPHTVGTVTRTNKLGQTRIPKPFEH
jgi:Na+-driven multidrug efflux pump